jgi:hypothetical protein
MRLSLIGGSVLALVFAGLRAEFETTAGALVNGFERPEDDRVKVTAINPGSAGSDGTATITSIAYCG